MTHPGVPTWADYLQVVDAQQWIGGTYTGERDAANLQLITSMACDWVQSYLARPIGSTACFKRFDGWSGYRGSYLMLPFYPVISVDTVVEYRGGSGPYTLTESVPSAQVDGWQCEYETGRLIRVFPGNVQKPWFPGSQNIEITWHAGYSTIPASLKVATLELIKHWWENTQDNPAVNGAPGVGAEYDADIPAGGVFAGVPHRIEAMLQPYQQVGVG